MTATHDDLSANLKRFLEEVVPKSELEYGDIDYPDDPTFDILGLPRILSSKKDISWLMNAVDDYANGLTLYLGSLGSGSAK